MLEYLAKLLKDLYKGLLFIDFFFFVAGQLGLAD
jgi:hypothetical protein